jgi:hypothetical protein
VLHDYVLSASSCVHPPLLHDSVLPNIPAVVGAAAAHRHRLQVRNHILDVVVDANFVNNLLYNIFLWRLCWR